MDIADMWRRLRAGPADAPRPGAQKETTRPGITVKVTQQCQVTLPASRSSPDEVTVTVTSDRPGVAAKVTIGANLNSPDGSYQGPTTTVKKCHFTATDSQVHTGFVVLPAARWPVLGIGAEAIWEDGIPGSVALVYQQLECSTSQSGSKALVNWSKKHAKLLGALLVALMISSACSIVGPRYGWWQAGVVVLAVSIVATITPILFSFLGFAGLNDPGDWFDKATDLGDQQQRLVAHYSRIRGTLQFWKNKAAAHYRLHLARVFWSLLSAVILPVLIQRFDRNNGWSVLFMTVLTTWTGLIVALAYTFKSEERYQGLRQQESDFYDVSRGLLDSAFKDDAERNQKVNNYIEIVRSIRRTARRVETGSPPSAL